MVDWSRSSSKERTLWNTKCGSRAAFFVGFVTLVLSGCTTPVSSNNCTLPSDCSAGLTCVNGTCVTSMTTPPIVECYQNTDCEENERCVEGNCFVNECVDGTTEECTTACGVGIKLCSGGVWRSCNKQPSIEICGTNEDEDCDQMTDEGCGGCTDGEERPCETTCGQGVERCFNNQFTGCNAPRPRLEQCGEVNGILGDEDCDGRTEEGCADCEDGQSQACGDPTCGDLGTQFCLNRSWGDCSVPPPSDEICDNKDNDCDGDVDEDILRDCSNRCGSGSEECSRGAWIGCNAPENCNCTAEDMIDTQVCELCGERRRECVSPQWGAWSQCQMTGLCLPGDAETSACGLCGVKRRNCVQDCTWGEWQACLNEGVCTPGEEQRQPCVNGCGEQVRRCTDECAWGEWSSCDGPGVECSPDEIGSEACGTCGGRRSRTCSAECKWGGWGECEQAPDSCTPGDTQDMACGQCQTQTRSCTNQCTWGQWGTCTAGTCNANDTETRPCGYCGTQTRTCTTNCGWSDWSQCRGQGECAPDDTINQECGSNVGACRTGTITSTCNSSCLWVSGQCEGSIGPASVDQCGSGVDANCDGRLTEREDRFEDNDTCGTCFSIGQLDPDNYMISATIDGVRDNWDYYCFQADDSGWSLGEIIEITLTNIPPNNDYDLYLYRSIADCQSDNQMQSSANGANQDETIFWRESITSPQDDSGIYVIGVKRYGQTSYSCDLEYSLRVTGLR